METAHQEYNAVTLRQKYPCLHLLRAFRLALDLRRLLLGTVAVYVLAWGHWVLYQLPFKPEGNYKWPWENPLGVSLESGLPSFQSLFRHAMDWNVVIAPLNDLIVPLVSLVRTDQSLAVWAFNISSILLVLIVWAFVGGAISRQVAVEFATDQKISLRETIGFTGKYFVSYFTSPLLPILGIGFFWILCLVGGFIGRIPGLGDLLVGLLYFIPLLFGFLMTLLLAGLVVGYPLMITTISTEASDSFDGFSRSFNYLFSRTLYFAGLVFLMLVLGGLSIWLVTVAAAWITELAAWGVSSGMGTDNVTSLLRDAPKEQLGSLAETIEKKPVESSWGTPFATVWMVVFNLMVKGFVVSFFWTSATIIYFLLRKSDDGTGLNEVFWEESEKPDQPFPVVEADAQDGENLDDTVDANSDEDESKPSDEESS